MKLYDVVSYKLKTESILTEGWSTLTENQRTYLNTAERELWPLMEQLTKAFEAELTPAQIHSIFKGAEDHAMASGGHKSALGKAGQIAKLPIDIMRKLNAKVDELGRLAQNAGPVKDMDAKFQELKNKIGTDDGKIVQGIKAVSDWAKANPGKASLAVAILTAAAAFATGGAGGAAVGFLLRSTTGLLKGEKLSTAAGKAVKTAAIGALAGVAFKTIGDAVIGNIEASGQAAIDATADSAEAANVTAAMADAEAQFGDLEIFKNVQNVRLSGNINAFHYNYDVLLTGDDLAQYNSLRSAVQTAAKESGQFSDQGIIAAGKFHDFMWTIQNSPDQETARAAIAAIERAKYIGLSGAESNAWANDTMDLADFVAAAKTNIKGGAAAIQGGVQQAGELKAAAVKAGKPKVAKDSETPPTGESVDYETYLHQRLDELVPPKTAPAPTAPAPAPTAPAPTAPAKQSFGQRAKAGLGNLAGKAIGAIGRGAKELGNKVTLAKLTKAWKQLGSPTDTGSIINILGDTGLSNQEITAIGSTAKVDLGGGQATAKAEPAPAGTAGGGDTAQAGADPLNDLAKQIQASGQSDLVKLALQLSAAGVTKQQIMTADIHNEAELYESKLAVMLNQRLK